jgi:hypothetical protein
VGKVAGDTAYQTLTSLGLYETERWTEADLAQAPDPYALAIERRMDDLVFGRAYLDAAGLFALEMSVWSREEERIVLTESRTARSVLDIFKIADEIVASLMEAFSGAHIGFGTIELQPSGEPGSFAVYIDGVHVGDDLTEVQRVLNGERKVEIRQQRLLGQRTIAAAAIMVIEDDWTDFVFELPRFIAEEAAHIDGMLAAARRGWHQPDQAQTVAAALAALARLYTASASGIDYSPEQATLRVLESEFAVLVERRSVAALAADAAAGKPGRFDALALLPHSAAAGDRDNVVAFRQFCLIGATAAYLNQDTPSIQAFRAASEASQKTFPLLDNEQYSDDFRYLEASLRRIEATAGSPGRVGLGSTATLLGLAGGAFSAYAFSSNLLSQLQDKADSINSAYLDARDPAEIESLRKDLETASLIYNAAEIGKWAGIGLGAVGVPLGIKLISDEIFRKTRERKQSTSQVGDNLLAAVATLERKPSLSSQRTLVLSLPTGLPLRDQSGVIRRTPFVLDGAETAVFQPLALPSNAAPVVVDPGHSEGLAVLYLGPETLAQPSTAVELKANKKGTAAVLSWAAETGASGYVVQLVGIKDGQESVERRTVAKPLSETPKGLDLSSLSEIKVSTMDEYGFPRPFATLRLDQDTKGQVPSESIAVPAPEADQAVLESEIPGSRRRIPFVSVDYFFGISYLSYLGYHFNESPPVDVGVRSHYLPAMGLSLYTPGSIFSGVNIGAGFGWVKRREYHSGESWSYESEFLQSILLAQFGVHLGNRWTSVGLTANILYAPQPDFNYHLKHDNPTYSTEGSPPAEYSIQRPFAPVDNFGASLVLTFRRVGLMASYYNGLSFGLQYSHPILYRKGQTPASQKNQVFSIGDTGPAGGIVFYDKGKYSDGWRYLEAAPADLLLDGDTAGVSWGGYGKAVGTTARGTATGSGSSNTTGIVAAYGSNEPYAGTADYAALRCNNIIVNGHDDWYLPSKDELNLLFELRDKIGAFKPSWYWTSTEGSGIAAWGQNFLNGLQGLNGKMNESNVRPIRYF